ncbi:hypothetical protein WMY93_023216 [Mugilogobius chulae]|uniref:Kinesin-like protein n=1 Tax=Mugilogobius chulae TaxID=88201 RepID=A0AAW0N3P9_9GOBI
MGSGASVTEQDREERGEAQGERGGARGERTEARGERGEPRGDSRANIREKRSQTGLKEEKEKPRDESSISGVERKKSEQQPEKKSQTGPPGESEAARAEKVQAPEVEMPKAQEETQPERRSSASDAQNSHTLQTEKESPDSHVMEVQSVKSEDTNMKTNDNKQLMTKEKSSVSALSQPATETASENEELSLIFESFLHNNGMLYSCFNHHGNRVYVDETQKLQPFPQEWYSQGHFISPNSEGFGQQQNSSGPSAFREDDRTSSTYIQGKGTVMTYWFEEKVNVCRFWDPQAGLWLILPLQWELNLDFVKDRVQQVMTALPGLVDQKEITAALRHCNYDADESLLERDRVIEELKRKLQSKDKEMETLFQRNSYLKREARYLTDVVQHLNHKLAELEADQQEAREKIRSLIKYELHDQVQKRVQAKTKSKQPQDQDQIESKSAELRPSRCKSPALNPPWIQARCSGPSSDTRPERVQQTPALHGAPDARRHEEPAGGTEGGGRTHGQEEQRAVGQVEELRSLYRKEAVERKSLYNKLLELQGNIRVFCRCRKSTKTEACLDSADEQEVAVVQKGNRKKFQFDKVYGSSSTQEEVFAGTLPVISSCVDGYNVCILAYGQTGSGKTYTMMGTKEQPGVNIRSIRELLRICEEKDKVTYTLKISMLEIYNETLNDLLSKTPGSALDLRVQGKSVSVPGLTQVQVQTESDILSAMETGEKNRKIAATKMNIQSSRSHLVVALEVEGSDEVSGLTSRGTLTLCDLAGSERISKTEATGQRLVEAAAINKSLTALGQVFSALKCNALHARSETPNSLTSCNRRSAETPSAVFCKRESRCGGCSRDFEHAAVWLQHSTSFTGKSNTKHHPQQDQASKQTPN